MCAYGLQEKHEKTEMAKVAKEPSTSWSEVVWSPPLLLLCGVEQRYYGKRLQRGDTVKWFLGVLPVVTEEKHKMTFFLQSNKRCTTAQHSHLRLLTPEVEKKKKRQWDYVVEPKMKWELVQTWFMQMHRQDSVGWLDVPVMERFCVKHEGWVWSQEPQVANLRS